ncbi:MAG: hypothetical protein FIA89_03850 [Geobacter sp.]|nr:hypothetical protein [Geobacter sp.]
MTTAILPVDLDAVTEEYLRLRPIMIRLHTEISRLLRKEDRLACAKRLQMLSKENGRKIISFAHEFEVDIFQDYQIYMYRPRGINAVQQMLNRKSYPAGSDERRLLEGMVQARFSVFLVKQIIERSGFIGYDLYTGDEFFILDKTLPTQDVVGLMIGFRLFPFGSYWMHSGANLTLGYARRNMDAIKPLGSLRSVREEQQLNDEVIFKWRDVVSELDD